MTNTPFEGDVERVARALLNIEDSWNDYEWEYLPANVQALFRTQARAALASLSPTQEIERLRGEVERLKAANVERRKEGDELLARATQAEAQLATVREEAWQDIETFAEPAELSSGNGVLVSDADGTVGEAYYRNFGDKEDGWWWANTSWGDYPEADRPNPSHWMPLPSPPALRNLKGEDRQ